MAVLLVLALVTPLFSPFFRKVEEEEITSSGTNDTAAGTLPPVSIVLVEHDCSRFLERTLPNYLSQEYPADYQVIVVADQSDSQSEEYLKALSEHNPQLYYTFLPDSSRYLSRKKLGLTLGIRAAKHEWVLIADVNCVPSSDKWLASVARHCTDQNNMVLLMTPYEKKVSSFIRFEHLRTMLYHLHSAQKGMAFSTNQSAVMMHRSEFFSQRGFYGNLEYSRAEFEFLVNKFAEEGKCAIAIEPEARMEQLEQSDDTARMKRLYSIDALKTLMRSSKFKFMYRFDLYTVHLFNFIAFVAFVCGIILTLHQSGNLPLASIGTEFSFFQPFDGILLLGGSALIWLISIIERCYIYSSKLNYFNSVSSFVAVMMEWTMSLRNTILRIRYMMTDKNDFITHKL